MPILKLPVDRPLPDFHYARDHERGPGVWCVRGKYDFYMPAPDKLLAFAIAQFMSGESRMKDNGQRPDELLADWRLAMDCGWRPTNWPPVYKTEP